MWHLITSGKTSFINSLDESVHKVFQQFLPGYRVSLQKQLHNTLALELKTVIERFYALKFSENLKSEKKQRTLLKT